MRAVYHVKPHKKRQQNQGFKYSKGYNFYAWLNLAAKLVLYKHFSGQVKRGIEAIGGFPDNTGLVIWEGKV